MHVKIFNWSQNKLLEHMYGTHSDGHCIPWRRKIEHWNLPSRQDRVRLVSSRWFLTRWFAFLIGCFNAYPNIPGQNKEVKETTMIIHQVVPQWRPCEGLCFHRCPGHQDRPLHLKIGKIVRILKFKAFTNKEIVDRLVAEAGSPSKGVFSEVREAL